MKKPILITILILVSILVALWSPWLKWKFDLIEIFGVEKAPLISGLQVYSLSGEIEVFVDGESKGSVTTEESPLIVDNIEPGEKLVRIQRETEVPSAYTSFNQLVDFEENTDIVISINLGPTEDFSEWHIIYPDKKDNANEQSNLNISVNTEDTEVSLDGVNLSFDDNHNATYPITLDKQFNLKIFKAGYEEQEITLLPETQGDRDKLKDYDINVDVHLMLQPLIVE